MDYAGFWRRLAAALIDGIILSIINGIVMAISPQTGMWLGTFIGIAYIVGFWTWNNGQTPGKMALGIRIVKTDGSPISFGVAILRYIGYWVSSIILYIGFLMIAWDSKKQGLHDKIAGTYVVRTG